ncbi:unnamed protein product [Ilex paraguariensis]|uniref:Uncharacterized protein n=1 Tax=Ilex paraguariensis TaxID=185542 RepID=A0ABC8S9G6_9AQUA
MVRNAKDEITNLSVLIFTELVAYFVGDLRETLVLSMGHYLFRDPMAGAEIYGAHKEFCFSLFYTFVLPLHQPHFPLYQPVREKKKHIGIRIMAISTNGW